MNEYEKLLREFEKFIEDNDGELSEDLVEEFMLHHEMLREENDGETQSDEERASDLLYEIYDMDTAEEQHEALEEVLRLNPCNIDALLMRMEQEDLDVARELPRILEIGKAYLHEKGLDDENSIGSYWGIIETRPYIRAMRQYMDHLREVGKFTLALEVGREVLRLNEMDNTGARTAVLSTLVSLERYDEALAFYQQWNEDSAFMILPMILLCIRLGRLDEALRYYQELQESNAECAEVFDEDGLDVEAMRDAVESGMYQPYSRDELYCAIFENVDIMMLNPDENFEFFYTNLKENSGMHFRS